MIFAVYQKLGAAGVITDGGIRDITGIRHQAKGFQVFAKGAVVSHGSSIKVDVNIPVSVGGLEIKPGDLLHGDESGFLKIPIEIAYSVIKQAEKVKETEAAFFSFLNKETPTLEQIKIKLGGVDIAKPHSNS